MDTEIEQLLKKIDKALDALNAESAKIDKSLEEKRRMQLVGKLRDISDVIAAIGAYHFQPIQDEIPQDEFVDTFVERAQRIYDNSDLFAEPLELFTWIYHHSADKNTLYKNILLASEDKTPSKVHYEIMQLMNTSPQLLDKMREKSHH